MQRARAKDWLIGATGMLFVLVIGAAIFWWQVSDPAGTRVEVPGSAPPAVGGGPPAKGPPSELREDEVWFAGLTLKAGTVMTADSALREVRAVGRDVVTTPRGLVAARIGVEGTVPFPVVAEELGRDTVVRAGDDGNAVVVRTIEALGRELRVVATGTVEVRDGSLVVEPRSIDIGGPDFLSEAIASVVRRLVTIEHEIEGLPNGLVLQDVTVQRDGFRASLRGVHVRLVP